MKFLVLFAVLLTSYLSSAGLIGEGNLVRLGFGSLEDISTRSNVNKDLDEILALVPRSNIEGIVKKWIEKDQEVKNVWEYSQSENVKERVRSLESIPEFKVVMQQLTSVHVNVPHFANQIHEILGMEPMTRMTRATNVGLRGCLDEVKGQIPMTKIILKAGQKLIFSSEFRGLISLVRNSGFQNNLNTLLTGENVTSFVKDAEANGVDMKAVVDFIKSLSPIYYELTKSDLLF